MIRALLLSFIVLATNLHVMAIDKVAVRKLFYAASQSKAQTDALYNYLRTHGDQSSFATGYTGMYHMLQARYAFNPVSKLNSFSRGKKMLDEAVAADRSNTELRFLRLSVQANAPSFLGYDANIDEDKRHIVATYATLTDGDLKARIKEYMARLKIKLD